MLASKLLDLFYKKNIRFITGVPDSCTSELSKFLLNEKNKKFTHLIAPNEGTAVSLGIGHYLTTKKYLVFIYKILVLEMQQIQ